MQAPVHIRIRERTEPFRILGSDLGRGHGSGFWVDGFGVGGSRRSWRIDFEYFLLEPVLLSLFLESDESISFAGLQGD